MSANTNFLKIFKDGETVKAKETNDNNQYLLNRIDESAQNLFQYLETEIEKLQGNFILPGFIIGLPYDTVPVGYLKCDGSSLLIADYPDLYEAIGTIYGQEDSTMFNLPDFRGKFLRGVGGNAATIGTLQKSAAPNITGSFTVPIKESNLSTSGAFTSTFVQDNGGVEPETNRLFHIYQINLKASRSSSVYKDGLSELYPDNYSLHWIIKY